MRDVAKSDDNVATINDRIGGCNVFLTFRMPTTAEREVYDRKSLKLKGRKLINKTFELNLFFGKKLCTGLVLAKQDAMDKWDEGLCYEGKPFSSNKDDGDYYREDWKALIVLTSADLLVQLAAFIFNAVGIEEEDDDDDDDLGLGGLDDEAPLPVE